MRTKPGYNEVSTAYCVPNLSGQNSKFEQTLSYSLLANQSSCPQLDHEDLEQIDEYDLEEMDLKWQVAMISMRMKKFYKKTWQKATIWIKRTWNSRQQEEGCMEFWNKDGSRTGQKEDSKALVTIDGEGVDWTNHSEDEDYALMACNSSDSDTEVISCSNKCKESYANLKKLYDAQREQLSDASIEIKAYSQGLKKVEAQLVAHQQGQLWYEQKIKFMKIDLDDKTDVLTYHKKLLAEAQKEKEDLKAKVEKWHNSSKNLSKLLNTQMSANDKFGLGYGDHRYDGILSYENEVLHSEITMLQEPDVEIDDFKFTYGPKTDQPSELNHNQNVTKVWALIAPIIEEYESLVNDEGPTFAEFSQTLMVGPVAFGGSRVYDHGKGGLTCLIAKATTDESNKWHRRWIENQLNQKVKTIRCDNGTEFKNRDVIEFCGSKGIKREYSNARTPQQNGVAERKNRTLIEAARTMLADSFLPNTFWAEAVSTACYVLNRVLVTKPHNKTPYELLTGDSEIKKMNLLRLLCMPIWPSYSSKSTSALNQMIRKKSPRGGDPTLAVQTRSKLHKSSRAHAFVSYVQKQRRNNHKDFQHCLFACFLSQHEPKKISEALEDESWVDAMQEELLQFEIHKVWVLVDLPYGKKAIGTKWVYRNKNDERGVVVINKASAFLYGKIDEEVYVSQPPGFIDPKMDTEEEPIDKTLFLKKDKHDIILVQVYVDDIIFGSTKKSWCDEFEALMKSRFQMSSMGELTFFLGLLTASTPIETQKPLVKDEEASDVDVHLYRSMIGSLMYLTASRPDIMFAVCACSRFQVTPKSSHLSAVKRIFRYLKGKPKLGLWYPRVSSFDLESYSDSDYAGANLDRKSTTGGCQFLGRRLISWQCKKQTIVATSTTEAEYVAAASCCGQVLWIQNQMLDYGFNFMNTKIYIDNESTICIVKNPHNMVAYLEKSKGNAEFHEVIDFLKRSSIHHALIVLLVEFLEVLHPVINPFLGYEGDMISKVSMISVSLSKDSQEKASQRNIGCTKSLYPNKGGSLLKRMLMMKGGDSENDDEDKEIDENILCTEDVLSTDKEGVSTDMEKVSTDRQIVSTDGSKVGTDRQIEGTEVQNEGTQEKNEGTQEKNEGIQEKNEGTEEKNEVTEEHIEGTEEQVESTDGQRKGIEDHTEEESATQATQTPTSTIFGDDETIAKVLLNMSQAKAVSREKEKGVELKDIEETDRPRPTSTRSLLTLKPLPKD
ncbi:putative ribonuclease H-like domain-containing protein [Tanacetum coccineum]